MSYQYTVNEELHVIDDVLVAEYSREKADIH